MQEVSKKQAVVFGPTLAALRKAKGHGQKALSAHSGVSEGLIANLETSNRQPSRATLEALARALDVPVEAIGVFLADDDDETLSVRLPELVVYTRRELAVSMAAAS